MRKATSSTRPEGRGGGTGTVVGGSSGSGSGGKGGGEACLEHAVEPARASRVIRGAQIRRGPPAFGGGGIEPCEGEVCPVRGARPLGRAVGAVQRELAARAGEAVAPQRGHLALRCVGGRWWGVIRGALPGSRPHVFGVGGWGGPNPEIGTGVFVEERGLKAGVPRTHGLAQDGVRLCCPCEAGAGHPQLQGGRGQPTPGTHEAQCT